MTQLIEATWKEQNNVPNNYNNNSLTAAGEASSFLSSDQKTGISSLNLTNIPTTSGNVANLSAQSFDPVNANNKKILLTTTNSTETTTMANHNETTGSMDWLEMPKLDTLSDLFSFSCSTAVIFGALIPYIPQYLKIRQSSNSEGFSTYGKR